MVVLIIGVHTRHLATVRLAIQQSDLGASGKTLQRTFSTDCIEQQRSRNGDLLGNVPALTALIRRLPREKLAALAAIRDGFKFKLGTTPVRPLTV